MPTPQLLRRYAVAASALFIALAVPTRIIYSDLHRKSLNHDLADTIGQQDADPAHALLHSGADISKNPSALMRCYKAALDLEDGLHGAAFGPAPPESLPLALLNAGAPPNSKGDEAYCLYGAVHFHHHSVVVKLLGSGVKFDASTALGRATFMDANADDAQTLVQHGANTEVTDADGETALFHADSLKAVTLLNAHAQIEARNPQGQTPLIYNCANGNDDAVLVLLAGYAKVASRDLRGTTPILAAAAHCRLETIKALVRSGADLHAKKKDGTTALMYSLYNRDDRVFDWLLSHSPDVNAHGMEDNTALSIATQLQQQGRAAGEPVARYDKAVIELQKKGAR